MIWKVSPGCKLCDKCVYYKRQNSVWATCDYIGVEGHSRIFDDKGRHRLKKGTCDKFKEKRKKRKM